jgi:hypothetical protein
MSKRSIRTPVSVDTILLFIWSLALLKNLTPLQEGLGIGLTFAFNLAFIPRRSSLRLFAPRDPVSIRGIGRRNGRTRLRLLQAILSILDSRSSEFWPAF